MEFFTTDNITEFIKQSQYTGLIVFLIAFLETLFLVGFFFPGSVALIAIGGLIATGYLDLWTTLFWAFAGAVVGDNLSFWIGVYFQEPLKKTKWHNNHQEAFTKGEEFFHKYGIYSVALGRFIGPIRAVIPAIAGSLGMSGRTFFIVNVVSALIWAPVYILPGLFVGDFYNYIKQYIQLEFWSLFLIGLSTWIAYLIIKHSKHTKKSIAYITLFLISMASVSISQVHLL
ncbi:MAG: DedA family protein [Gammaproteobacteria bacterium]|nr:DedA family protein [Gammaproteobacteria bacterium]